MGDFPAHRKLLPLAAQHLNHARKQWEPSKRFCNHVLEGDGAVIMDMEHIDGLKWIPLNDDDGGTKWNRDGSEAGYRMVALSGERSKSQEYEHGKD
ncbi:hypothetical protein HF896_17675 [Alicycliphilus denitrificans]|uniref:Uncharacterized protein n=1 Tax=Alicycliphilus denitrificans TaxID=179636 RepID=A0A858ZXG6_9BURK|nr:hypothetical protein [Alicycliphilus denitrificans]QKD45332.1 hypothetical protein HF896_17675 [Alicycliphilus denitrificans]